MTERGPHEGTAAWQRRLDAIVESLQGELCAVRRHLHSHPEPSNEERATAAYVRNRLEAAGLEVRGVPGCHGLIVDSPGAAGGERSAIRADMDALRLHDLKSADYRSQVDGVMHACGHDAHTTAALGAALVLRRLEKEDALPWPVAWRAIFQPAEETAEGALQMAAGGAADDLHAIFALHADPSREVGRIGIRNGPLTASCDWLRITVTGRGGHGARPHESQDPIAAAAHLVSSIYSLLPRSIDSQDPVVVTIGRIEGGYTANVIPEQVKLEGALRALSETVRAATRERLRRLARGIAEAADVAIDVEFPQRLDAVVNDARAADIIRRAAAATIGPEAVEEIPRPSMGGEDFAGYLRSAPGAMFRLGVRSGERGAAPLHSPHFDIDERALGVGAAILARCVILDQRPDPTAGS